MGLADDIAAGMVGPGKPGEEAAEPKAEASDEEMKGQALIDAIKSGDGAAAYEACMACLSK
jgi:hypothetical protein